MLTGTVPVSCFTLEELGDKLVDEYNFPVSRATLYNTIKLFLELRLVIRHRFQGTTRYEACYDDNSHSHQVCTVCGKVTEVKVPEVTKVVSELHLKRFRKDGYSLYIYGICSICQAHLTRQRREQNKQKEMKEQQKLLKKQEMKEQKEKKGTKKKKKINSK